MPKRWRKPRRIHVPHPDPVDLNTLRTELHRATDAAAERVAAIIDDRLDGYHADLLKRHHDLMDQVVSLTVQVRSLEHRVRKMDAITARNPRWAAMSAAQGHQARRHTSPRTAAPDEPF